MKEKTKARVLTQEEAKTLAEAMEPFKLPKLKKRVKRTCENCQDYVVCLAYETLKSDEQAQECKSWRLDYLEYERLCKEQEKAAYKGATSSAETQGTGNRAAAAEPDESRQE